uniref:F-box family protein n=1 Tax=Solanum tuberosum TaxID=4113 RepID=M1DUU8_SOLTU
MPTRSIVLWNPSIHMFTSILVPSINTQSPHMFVLGFGVDFEDDDYKLYKVLESWSGLYYMILVASMEKVIGFRNNGDVLFSTRRNDLVSYDPNSGQNTDLGIRGISHSFYVQNYMESLILLKGNNVNLGRFLGGMEVYGFNE